MRSHNSGLFVVLVGRVRFVERDSLFGGGVVARLLLLRGGLLEFTRLFNELLRRTLLGLRGGVSRGCVSRGCVSRGCVAAGAAGAAGAAADDFVVDFFAGAFFAGAATLAFAFLLSSTDSWTNSINAIGALSPLRGPTLVIRV